MPSVGLRRPVSLGSLNLTKTKPAPLKAPFPWFGGKSRAAPIVWARFGTVKNYVEPFFGSGAVLLSRPDPSGTETVNDADGLLANFWRALRAEPATVAQWADNPVNENDLHARHAWLVGRKASLQTRLEGDPDWYDPKIAGWWVWGLCCWIGSGWCEGKGPWHVVGGQLVKAGPGGVKKQIPHLANKGRGVNRQLPSLRNGGMGVINHLEGRGVNRKLPELRSSRGVFSERAQALTEYLEQLALRLARVRVCCGDWSRVCTPTPTVFQGLTAVFLAPPYLASTGRDMSLYNHESGTVAAEAAAWCREHGDDPRLRIALCGYEGEHRLPRGWTCVEGKATNGGYGNLNAANKNAARERIWFSPHCLKVRASKAA